VAALAALPVLVWAAITPQLQLPKASVALVDRAPWFFLSVPPVILAVALSGVWRRYLEPRLTPHLFAGEPAPRDACGDVRIPDAPTARGAPQGGADRSATEA
jgi:hypothetical protein